MNYIGKAPGANVIQIAQSDMKLLDVRDCAGLAVVDFLNLTGYESYRFGLSAVRPVNDNTNLWMRCSGDNGATFDAVGPYTSIGSGMRADSSALLFPSTGTQGVPIANVSNHVNHGINGEIVTGDLIATGGKYFVGQFGYVANTLTVGHYNSTFVYDAPTKIANAVRFMFSAGNFGAGRLSCYGLRGTPQAFADLPNAPAASQAEQEAALAANKYVSPAMQKFHPAMPKAWAVFNGTTGALKAGHNVASVVRNAVADYSVNFTVPFSSADYAALVTIEGSGAWVAYTHPGFPPTAGTVRVLLRTATSGAAGGDVALVSVVCFGDQ